MKKTMKKCLTLLLALAMLLAMAVPAVAEENYSREITFTGVAEGDTVKAGEVVAEITATMKTDMRILTKNTSTVTKRTDTIITITKGVKWKSTASALSFTTAVRHSTFTNSTTSSPPDGAATSSVPKAYAISATTATCPTSLNRQAPRSN